MKQRDLATANQEVFRRLCESDPVLTGIAPALNALPGMTATTILTSGPPMAWQDYQGGQRQAVIGAARFEGLADDDAQADQLFGEGRLRVAGCHEHGCVGSLAGVYSASMPVFAVQDRRHGNVGHCNLYEGTNPRRLNYGVYDEGVHERLLFVQDVVAPCLAQVIARTGGVALKPLMARALHMGDELHSRSTVAALLFMRELLPCLLDLARSDHERVQQMVQAMTEDHYFFLRLSMAAAKATADAAHGVEGSSVVTAMCFNCRGFAIRVSGLGDRWFTGPHASVQAHLFEGHGEDEISWMGGESTICETVGLGGFAQAAAFTLQRYQGGSAEAMVSRNVELYDITVGEHSDYQIPYLGFRGTPTGIDLFRVLRTGVTPVMDIGIAGRDGGQIGAGVVRAPRECFAAAAAFEEQYGTVH